MPAQQVTPPPPADAFMELVMPHVKAGEGLMADHTQLLKQIRQAIVKPS